MVNPGAFNGSRKEFLLGEKEAYAAGVEGGFSRDALAIIQRRYFKRYPLELPHDEEPSQEALANVNDEEPEQDYDPPDEEKMEKDEYECAMGLYRERQKLLLFRKGQIKRWLSYQYMKDHDLDSRDTASQSPYRILLSKLTSGKVGHPRLKTPASIWRRSHREEVELETKKRAAALRTPKNKVASLREAVASELFSKLSKEEKARYKAIAEQEHNEAVAEWESKLHGDTSTDPADRQRCIDNLSSFMRPILEGVCAATGWVATFTIGGPEPAVGGRLNILSLHIGHAPGDIKMTYGRAERPAIKKHCLPSFGRFLRTVYSIEDCRACALPENEQIERQPPAEDDPNEDIVSLDSLSESPIPPGLVAPDRNSQLLPQQSDSTSTSAPQPTTNTPTSPSNEPLPPMASATIPQELDATPTPNPDDQPIPTTQPSSVPQTVETSTSVSMTQTSAVSPPQKALTEHLTSRAPSPPPPLYTISRPSSPPRRPRSTSVDHGSSGQSAVSGCQGSESPEPHAMEVDEAPSGQAVDSGGQAHAPWELGSTEVDGHQSCQPIEVTSTPISSPPPMPHTSQQSLSPLHVTSSSHGTNSAAISVPPIQAEDDNEATPNVSSGPTDEEARPPVRRSKRRQQEPDSSVGTIEQPAASRPVKRTRRSRRPLRSSPRRTSSATPPSEEDLPTMSRQIEPPESAPDYVKNAIKLMNNPELGRDWLVLVRSWMTFEVAAGYKQTKVLGNQGRPLVLQDWIARCRPTSYRPRIADAREYVRDFKEWWAYLQPEWRRSEDGELIENSIDGDWSCLRLGGRNGFLTVMAGLYFFGLLTIEHTDIREDWERLLKDCSIALEKISDV